MIFGHAWQKSTGVTNDTNVSVFPEGRHAKYHEAHERNDAIIELTSTTPLILLM